jgi:putative MATE family efflux protein
MKKNRTEIFETMPVPKAVMAMAIPTIISQLISLVYNLADTFFVGQTNDPDQVAAVSLCFPAFMSLCIVSNLFGIGGGSLMSRSLGEKDLDKAKRTSAFSFYMSIGVVLIYSLTIAIFKKQFLYLLGADEFTYRYAVDYIDYVLILGGIPSMLNMLLAHLIRSEGGAKYASIGMSIGGVLNILLDPIFIMPWGLDMQTKGAAIATLISNVVATMFLLIYIYRNRATTVVSLDPRNISFRQNIPRSVFVIGFPASIQTALSTVSNTVLNNLASAYSASAMAALGIVKKIDMLPMNVTGGLSQGVMPLLGYNYASKNHDRMHKVSKYSRTLAVIFSLSCIALFELIPGPIVSLFIKDPQTIAYATDFLRIMPLATPFMAMSFMITSMFLATDQGAKAMTLAIFRKGLIDVPLMYLMNSLLPLYGLLWVQPMVDVMSVGLAFALYASFKKQLKQQLAGSSEVSLDH